MMRSVGVKNIAMVAGVVVVGVTKDMEQIQGKGHSLFMMTMCRNISEWN